jgi:predicted permease
MLDDARYTLRNLRRKPMLLVVAVLTLGLGVGGATSVFTVVNAVLLRALPFEEAERLVRVWELTRDGDRFSVSDPGYLELAATSRAFASVAGYRESDATAVLIDRGAPQRLVAVPVSASLVHVLGVQPQVGRMFTSEEDQPDAAERPVLLSDALWRSRFGGSPDVIGRLVTLNGDAHTVVGVMPPGLDFPTGADAWTPLRADPYADRTDKSLAVVARLAPGVTVAQAAAELRDVTGRWSELYPDAQAGWSAEAVPFSEWIITPRFRDAVWVLFGAVSLLLLLACANIANLLVAHAVSRQSEMRLRTALGAPRLRLVRQLFTESGVLALLGTAAGVLISVWSVDTVRALGGDWLPRADNLRVDGFVLLFASATGIFSCLTFGLAPAVYATRVDLRSGLEDGGRYTVRTSRLREVLVVVEVALALLLLVGAGLLANSFVRLVNVNPGFDLETTVAMPIEHPSIRYGDERTADFYRDLLERVRATPGIVAAGATTTNPFRQFGYSNSVTPEERAAEAPASGLVQAEWRSVTPGFFEAMSIPLLSGRTFTDGDREGTERVVVVSESLARRLWPGESPIGKRIYWGGTTGRTREVVGVSGDIRDRQLDAEPSPMLFLPHGQVPVPQLTVVVRTSESSDRIAPALRQYVRELDAGLPSPPVHDLASSRRNATMAPRFNLSLLASFAGIALVLAVTGVYATLAFMVAERRREMAVRMALGASGPQLARLVLRNGLGLAALGAALGIIAAVATTHLLARLLYGVQPTDPWTFTAATLALITAAALASYLPARRASRLDAAAVLTRGV